MAFILYFTCVFIGGYLLFNVAYFLISAIAGRLGSADDVSPSKAVDRFRRIAVLIPAYKEDAVIVGSVIANLNQTYPSDLFDLIVIADSFQPQTLEKLSRYPIQVIRVEFEQSTVQKSIIYALNSLPENVYDIVVISDADNHMAADFLERINQAFGQGWRAIQGHRVAKNTNKGVAIFDAMNEEVNNNLFRAGQRALGLSAMCTGSGMAFEPTLLKDALDQIKTVGGYDKELEMLLTINHIKVGYLQEAIIYDEKVQNVAVFNKQRTRWIAAQVYFVKAYFTIGIQQLVKGNGQAFNSMFRSLLLPRLILLTILYLLAFASLFIDNQEFKLLSLGAFGFMVISLAISIPVSLWQKLSIRDFLVLPMLIFSMFKSLLNFKKASKVFLHTPHAETSDVN
ncbi:glycosyltransferase [Spirosoma pollinicola]|uniref:Glycosyl transferase family 2 n=1 Tax=Spirosoma pollinicola TaxID=2057025 RepID=A0A2K8YSF8_9BACT|nr:glycosyltransferase family 2 protein [Spirosoma pollinicola]AUD00514.1 glycosyl transferase family 2 [Spirosoma pollinicola]